MTKTPQAKKIDHQFEEFGLIRTDPWFWLREKSNPEVKKYIEKENTYTENFLSQFSEIKNEIMTELKRRMIEDDESVGYYMDAYRYFKQDNKGMEYPKFLRENRDKTSRVELFDINNLSKNYDFFHIGFIEPSPDHKTIAVGVDTTGDEAYQLWLFNTEDRSWKKNILSQISDELEWGGDSKSILYVKLDEQQRPKAVYLWETQQLPEQSKSIFYESDERFFVSISKSEDNQFLLICSHGNNISEWRYLPTNNCFNTKPKLIWPRKTEHEYDVTSYNDHWIIKTNARQKNFEIISILKSEPLNEQKWQKIGQFNQETLIEDYLILKNYCIVQYSSQASPSIQIIHLTSGDLHDLEFDSPVRAVEISHRGDYDTPIFRFSYESLTTPTEIYDYHIESRRRELLKKDEIPGLDSKNYTQERVFATSHDGKKIPISIAYHQNTPQDGSACLLQIGYGAYGVSMECEFQSHLISLMDRGFVVALSHIRGGLDLGDTWYQEGKLLHKLNTFQDFHDVSSYLIAKKYTQLGKIIAWGGSAGGLLMGYIANQFPKTYGSIVSHVPFVDVLTTMLDDTLPLTTLEYNEWGNPNIEKYYHYIRAYSPYDNIKHQKYPEMLVIAGWNDPRVTYWEPSKWVAKLREQATNPEDIFLKVHDESGHFGASGRYAQLDELATDIIYMLYLNKKWSLKEEQRHES